MWVELVYTGRVRDVRRAVRYLHELARDGSQTCAAVSLSTLVCSRTSTFTTYELAVTILVLCFQEFTLINRM